MKVAVVTPYYKETDLQLTRCMDSVGKQTYKNVTHILVSDGFPKQWKSKLSQFEHITLPMSHDDAGATPRAIGALSAFSRGYDAVSFLDADNWYEPNHIEKMVQTMTITNARALVATRTIYSTDLKKLYDDHIESDGKNMADTNCMFLHRRIMHFLSAWITEPQQKMISDKVFWEICKNNGVEFIRCTEPTVAYVSKWAWHYQYAGVNIPDHAVWLVIDEYGNNKLIKHKDRGGLK